MSDKDTERRKLFAADKNKLLPEKTAAIYKVVGMEDRSPKIYTAKWGFVDFRTLTIPASKQLIKQGFPFLEIRKTNAAKAQQEAAKGA